LEVSLWAYNWVKLSSFVNKNKPNIVIYQFVERGLYNQSIVTLPHKLNIKREDWAENY
jgi:hypothetical protein